MAMFAAPWAMGEAPRVFLTPGPCLTQLAPVTPFLIPETPHIVRIGAELGEGDAAFLRKTMARNMIDLFRLPWLGSVVI
eukprot:CAMPEP_0119541482 /NCGR_PEP_ID=MMETSP1344-20130328/52987_1 /TAXON_ID=236787 /ORGANISM="Florenciella parvula, Strain CCMP2471" /LENGTH=78 /DNA_ID=CAMNT_0007585467 /DNA_START=150 /DNA_END=386 /DNA_ORIENTATION=+